MSRNTESEISSLKEMRQLFARVLNKTGFLTRLNFFIHTRVGEEAFTIPISCGLGLENLVVSERWMVSLLRSVLPLQTGAFIDVGANLGQTLLKLRAVDPSRPYIGFEPNPICVNYLNTLIRANRFADTTVLPVGLFTEPCTLQLDLYSKSGADSAGSLVPNFRPGETVYSRIFVPVMPFRCLNAITSGREIAMIKIDVEGGELEVFQTLRDAICAQRPLILFEILPCYSADNYSRLERQLAVEDLLSALEYSKFRIIKGSDGTLRTLEPMPSIGVHGKMELCDYIAIPEEKAAVVAAAMKEAALHSVSA